LAQAATWGMGLASHESELIFLEANMKIDKALLRLFCGAGLAVALVTTPSFAAGNKSANTTTGATDNDTGAATDTTMPESGSEDMTAPPSDTAESPVDTNMATGISFNELSSDEVKQIQSALNEQGSAIQVDGVVGPETKGALSDFQERNNLATNSSEISRETLTQLGLQDIMQAH
jgi:hypothetical protein